MEKELSKYGKVTRISGETPVENSIAFAKFKDEKQNLAGDSKACHGMSFVSNKTPDLAVAGASFSHMGKHALLSFRGRKSFTTSV